MDRRGFLHLAAAAPAIARNGTGVPEYRAISSFQPTSQPGMPGRYPGLVVRAKCDESIDPATEKVNSRMVREMLQRGMCELTGQAESRDAWAKFFAPSDVVGIKVNCSGAPGIMSTPEIVGAIVDNLLTVGVRPGQIHIYERFLEQVQSVRYEKYVPAGVHIDVVETPRGSILGYDPRIYVEADFFGEEDTRSNLARLVSERLTKIINVPNMKDHGAAGVTGCLKNIAYGSFSNVARSHRNEKTETLSFIGTLACVEPLRSRTVLQIMDGLRGVWHGGPFSPDRRFRFYPKQILFGTDPVAIDRVLLEVIEARRKAENACSVWDRSPIHIKAGRNDPNHNRFIREPGHIQFASRLGLGVSDRASIRLKELHVENIRS